MKIAVLDVDGTIFDGAVGLHLLHALVDRGLCDTAIAGGIFELLKLYARGGLERGAMVEQTTRQLGLAIAGRDHRQVDAVGIEVVERTRGHVFPFVAGFLADLARRGYAILLISSSPEQVVAPLAASLGVPDHRGALFTVSQGKYTGEVERIPGAPGQKQRILEAYLREMAAPPERIFAMGNSLSDLNVLELADYPLVFEPEPSLRRIAEAHGWTVASRDDVLEQNAALFGGR
jgi:phosphoserine phosphatase